MQLLSDHTVVRGLGKVFRYKMNLLISDLQGVKKKDFRYIMQLLSDLWEVNKRISHTECNC